MGKASTSLAQLSFRGRKDNVTLNSTTFDDPNQPTSTNLAINTNWTQPVADKFRIRFEIQESGGASQNNTFHLYYNYNGGGYTQVTASSSVVRVVDSTQYTDGDATTDVLANGTGTFQAGVGDDSDAVMPTAGNINVPANGHTEIEINLQFQSADVSNGLTCLFQVRRSSGVLETYTNTPTVTISKLTAYTLNAEPGSYTYTGQATTNLRALLLNAAAGSYTYTGVNTTDYKSFNLNAEPGSYTLSGSDTTNIRALILNAVAGSYTLTGLDIATIRALLLNAESGLYVYTGLDISTSISKLFNAEPGAYVLTGSDTTNLRALILNAESGALVITGANTGDIRALLMNAAAGAYTLSGAAATLTYTPVGGGGSTVLFFNGVSMVGAVTQHQGVSRPNVTLTDAGGGSYTVTKTHEEYDFKSDGVNRETYDIDGELP